MWGLSTEKSFYQIRDQHVKNYLNINFHQDLSCIAKVYLFRHLVLDFKTEVGPPVQIQKTLISTKITVFDEKVLLFNYVQSDSSRTQENSSGHSTNEDIELARCDSL